MCLTYGLAKSTQEAQEGIRVSDRRRRCGWACSAGRLNRAQDMPGIEQLIIPAATGESPADRDFLNERSLERVRSPTAHCRSSLRRTTLEIVVSWTRAGAAELNRSPRVPLGGRTDQ